MKTLFSSKLTVFLLLGFLILLVGIPTAIYQNSLGGIEQLGAYYLLIGLVLTALVMIVDRVLVRYIDLKQINIFEAGVIIVGIALVQYSNRKTWVEVPPNSNYFVLIENDGRFQNTELYYKFPFSKQFRIEQNKAILSSLHEKMAPFHFNTPANWNGYVMTGRNKEGISVQFYSKYQKYQEAEIDSLINLELERANISNSKKQK